MAESLTFEINDGVAVFSIDDGKANALSHSLISALEKGLDRAERDALAVLIVGRPGRLCAGFDLSVMQSGDEALRELVSAGAGLLMRLFTFRRPVIVACTGHAVAAGALILLASDLRIGVHGEFKIGLNEVSIGMPLPLFATELAQQRLSPRYLVRATQLAELYDPNTAVQAGFLDLLATGETVVETAFEHAARLAMLPQNAFQQTRDRLRGVATAAIRNTLTQDLQNISMAGGD